MPAVALVLAFALSLAPGLLAWWPAADLALLGAWQTPLALLPWLVLAGFPFAPRPPAGRVALLIAGLAPALALAVAADLRSGRPQAALLYQALVGLALCALWGGAASLARGARLRRIYGWAWVLCVPAAAALGLALAALGGPGPRAERALEASPLVWALRSISTGAASPAWGALALAGLGLALVGLAARSREERA